ncbi:MAG: replication-associated recombination protein A [Firmicutes bacterium]|nr:replication-associated recombination protein A [Bacillota bacterium]
MPLAARMRPLVLDEIVGQDHILGPGRLLRRAIEADRLGSVILYGPPGSGKTTIAEVVASSTKSEFVRVNAVTAGVADIRQAVVDARERAKLFEKQTILFIDEIHRFNRTQQDALLPAVEDGTVTLIGATTQNPFFDVNPPLVSRSRIFRLEPLGPEEIRLILKRALADSERGLGQMAVDVDQDALDHLADYANGDARSALNALEVAVLSTPPGEDGRIRITLAVAEDSIQRRALRYDAGGDAHYDVTSAFIKSIRGSDPDAALHYLARMLESGEDPRFIARRLMIHASEDVGLADSHAIAVAVAAAEVVERVGLPEARLALAHATIYIAVAPKSNSVLTAITSALEDVRNLPSPEIPAHLRDSSYKGAAALGHGKGYKYPHDHPGSHVEQQYMPDGLEGKVYYRPGHNVIERRIAERLAGLRRR